MALLLAIGCLGGCKGKDGDSSSNFENSSLEEVNSGLLYEGKGLVQLAPGQETELTIGKDVESQNYLSIQLVTGVNLVGYIHYHETNNTANTHKEKIYIEARDKTFSMFLDAFRVGAFGVFEKTIDKITLRNVSKESGVINVKRVDIDDRVYDNQETLYTSNAYLKIGASLAAGGSLCHVESLNRSVVEYIDQDGKVRIDQYIDQEEVNTVTDQVNLVNIHDLGREIQQSYYSHVNEVNGYAPDDDVLYEGNLLYNPVQAGSAGDKQSQIIDYRVDENGIYVKCRPQDWFLRNTQTDSYMESNYTFAKDGTLRVENRFVNFSEFKDMEKTWMGGQESPAIYIVHPLNYFYCETIEGEICDPNLLGAMTTPSKTSLSHEIEGQYHYTLSEEQVYKNWFAFVNDQKFGMGIYMPNMDNLVASRGWTTTLYTMIANHYYNSNIYQLDGPKYPSAYVNNYNYCCPSTIRRMADFVPFEYTFAVYVGTVEEMRDTFGQLQESKAITNESMEAWEGLKS